ncbi:hypothetical protein GQ457_01G027260 [Hibiscus cannabinus]
MGYVRDSILVQTSGFGLLLEASKVFRVFEYSSGYFVMGSCAVYGDVCKDMDRIFRYCPVAHSIWIPLICDDKIDDFFLMDFKQWLFVNLSNVGGFGRDGMHWDILFGSLLGSLWCKCNEWISATMTGVGNLFYSVACGCNGRLYLRSIHWLMVVRQETMKMCYH